MEDILIFATVASHSHTFSLNPVHQLSAFIWIFCRNQHDNCLALPITSTYKEFQERMDFAIKNTLRLEKERKFSLHLTLPVLNKGILL